MATCPVCNSANFKKLALYRSISQLFRDCYLSECNSCKLVFITNFNKELDLIKYNEDYFKSAHYGKPKDLISQAFFKAIASIRINFLSKYLVKNNITIKKVLEYGPGPGYFAEAWLQKFPFHQYSAIETDKSCHALLLEKKINLHKINEENTYDLVVMSHVLEHTLDPISFLTEAIRKLRIGGCIFIEVPCKDWIYKSVDEPHMLFFDKKPMETLLHNLGLVDIRLSYHGPKISNLVKASFFKKYVTLLRNKLIGFGLIAPFSSEEPGLEVISNSLERAVIKPFLAHLEQNEPSWWLRALARKE